MNQTKETNQTEKAQRPLIAVNLKRETYNRLAQYKEAQKFKSFNNAVMRLLSLEGIKHA